MENDQTPATATKKPANRTPWNKGKLVGAKPPLRPSHVWSIRTKLQMLGRKRDLALFNLAIDSKLRGCDVVAVRVVIAERCFASTTLHRAAMPWTAQPFVRRRRVGRCGSS